MTELSVADEAVLSGGRKAKGRRSSGTSVSRPGRRSSGTSISRRKSRKGGFSYKY
ncbi:MAG: hypothetical protein WA902_17170 [Thermosynechococcaceae cyanobacterium]